jgi:hypothetical protein
MACIFEPRREQIEGWKEFVGSRPPAVRAIAERFEPWRLYRMKSTGHRVTVHSFSEPDGVGRVTLTVNVLGTFNLVEFERQVFGVEPEDLEECELPGENEPVGAALSDDQVDSHIDELRLHIRPDLWERGPDGRVRRKDN